MSDGRSPPQTNLIRDLRLKKIPEEKSSGRSPLLFSGYFIFLPVPYGDVHIDSAQVRGGAVPSPVLNGSPLYSYRLLSEWGHKGALHKAENPGGISQTVLLTLHLTTSPPAMRASSIPRPPICLLRRIISKAAIPIAIISSFFLQTTANISTTTTHPMS